MEDANVKYFMSNDWEQTKHLHVVKDEYINLYRLPDGVSTIYIIKEKFFLQYETSSHPFNEVATCLMTRKHLG